MPDPASRGAAVLPEGRPHHFGIAALDLDPAIRFCAEIDWEVLGHVWMAPIRQGLSK
jgi:hypothetical protein